MAYKHLPEERKEHIDEVVEGLKSDYSTDSGIDFQSLAQDLEVGLLQTNRVGGEVAVRKGEKDYVFLPDYSIPSVSQYQTAHGLGHSILTGSELRPKAREDEANYLAEKLTGISKWKYRCLTIPQSIVFHSAHPIVAWRYAFGLHRADVTRLIQEMDQTSGE